MLINLHTHLEGRVRAETAEELARGAGVPAPPEGWGEALMLREPGTLTTYLSKVALTYPLFRVPGGLERIARECVEDAARGGVDHLELRFGPATHAVDEADVERVVRAVAYGLNEGVRTTGISAGLTVAALRHHDEDTNIAVARAAVASAGDGVVGFDLAGDEALYPDLGPHRRAFAIAQAAGLGLTCHAGEAGPASAVGEAVRVLGVTRIGHGVRLADDAGAVREAAAQGVVVEVCPTSNWFTGGVASLSTHPARELWRSGVRLVLGDDNPTQTGSDLASERERVQEHFGWGREDLLALDETSIEAAFIDEASRAALRERLRSEAVEGEPLDGTARGTGV